MKTPHADYELESRETTEYLKVERYYYMDLASDKKLYLYDQFLDKSIQVSDTKYKSEITFVRKFKAAKNIVYLNKPRDIEKLAKALSLANKIELT